MPDLSKNHPAVKGGTTVSTSSALTSAANTASYVQADVNKIQADVAALKATLDALITALTA